MNKTNEYYLDEIISHIDFIQEHMKGLSVEDLQSDEVLTDSMVFRLIQISECSKNLDEDYKELHQEVEWGDITALRNRLVHDYGNVNMSIVYNTLTKDLAVLRVQLSKLG